MFILKQNNDKALIVKGFTVKPGFFYGYDTESQCLIATSGWETGHTVFVYSYNNNKWGGLWTELKTENIVLLDIQDEPSDDEYDDLPEFMKNVYDTGHVENNTFNIDWIRKHFTIETLEKTWRIIVDGIEETRAIQENARKQRIDEVTRLNQIKKEFKEKFGNVPKL